METIRYMNKNMKESFIAILIEFKDSVFVIIKIIFK